jgi:hypothetical protein
VLGLARFMIDIFKQIGGQLLIPIENAFKDLMSTNAARATAMMLGQGDPLKKEGMNLRRQATGITPNYGLMGDLLGGTGFSEATKGKALALQEAQLKVQQEQLSEQKKANAKGPVPAVAS